MSLIQLLLLMSLPQVHNYISYEKLHIFVNRFHVNRTAYILITLETLGDIWYTTKVNVDERRLVDLFQTNTSETREPLHWYRTTNLESTLDFYNIFTAKPLPYQKCFYHTTRVNFDTSGHHNVSVAIFTNGLSAYATKLWGYIYVDLEENIRCEPQFEIPRCHDSNRPLHYETSEVLMLRASFTRRCPMDNFIQYYWTLHDSTEHHLLEFIGGTLKPELKLGRYRLKLRLQSPLNRMVMIRLNARVIGRRIPLVARCYLVLASQRVYAAIRGGQLRKVFRGKTIFFHANPSRDLSLPETGSQQLLYHWSCQAILYQVRKTCKTDMGTGKRIAIPAYSQPNEQSLRITLYIRSTFDHLRTAVAIQNAVFLSSPRRYIDINIICVNNCNANKFSDILPIHLKAQCLRCHTKKINKWTWTVENDVVGTLSRLIYDTKKIARRITIYLNIEATHRRKQTAIYQGTTSITLDKNTGPIDTFCNIKPIEGDALETLFFIQCQTDQARHKPLQYCVGIDGFLIEDCRTDELLMVRLPPTSYINILVCDNLGACINVDVTVDVRPTEIEDTETAIINHLSKARHWLEYADWQKSFILLYQLSKRMNTKERLIVFIETLGVYQPKTTLQLAHLVRLSKQLVVSLEPLDDMEVNVLARMLHIIGSTFKNIIASNELNVLLDDYYRTMVSDLCDLLNKFCAEWEFIPKSQCRAESESCLNIDNYRHRLEQMATLQPMVLEHINNWLLAHWKLSTCLFYMGMGSARRLHPEEGPQLIERSTFTMRMESFDLDLEHAIVIDSGDSMHTLIFTEKLLQELRNHLQSDEILISVRSHKQSQYWWYPEQESRAQVLVVNAYTANAIWEKTQLLSEPFQHISRLKVNLSANVPTGSAARSQGERHPRSHPHGIDFDDPEEDVENVVHDNVLNPSEIRMYRTELYAHSVLGITFTHVDIDFQVLLHMTNVPKLKDMDIWNSTCRVRAGATEPTALLLRNRCDKARPVFIYIRAENPSQNWSLYHSTGAYFTFATEIRSCRIWNYARPEPNWQNIFCMPEMNKSVAFGIHCKCNYISDLDADAKPIITVPMNLRCHLERPVVARSYEIVACFIILPTLAILFLAIKLRSAHKRDRRLYVEETSSGQICHSGDIVIKLTFGGCSNSGSSSNIVLSLLSSRGQKHLVVYQNPSYRNFQRNTTISFRLHRNLVQLPARLALGHDNSGIYPDFYCRTVILTDILLGQTQCFTFERWIRNTAKQRRYKAAKVLSGPNQTQKQIFGWKSRFSCALESAICNWYLFQPLVGPWRFGITRQTLCRWDRSCMFLCKIFLTMCIVVVYFGRVEPFACDPNPKKFTEVLPLFALCFCCTFVTFFIEAIMMLVHRIITTND